MRFSGPAAGVRRDHGYVILRSDRFGISTRVHARSVAVTSVMAAVALGALLWSLSVGEFPIPLRDVIDSVLGIDTPDTDLIIRKMRMPRGLTALLVGAAFGLSGAIFQRIAQNPLATPDIIGINSGAAAAAVYAIVVLKTGSATATYWALGGALISAAVIYLMAYRRGVSGYRLVLVGIGAAALGNAVVWYLITRADIYLARDAVVWLTGSLNQRTWDHVRPLSVVLAVLIPITAAMARHLRQLEMGDDAARGLGSRVELSRTGLLLCGVALAAVSVAAAGPVAFVALVAPQIARRLVGGRTLALLPSAVCGSVLMILADIAARRLFAPTELPVGIFTAVIGAPFLLYLLARANRIGSGG